MKKIILCLAMIIFLLGCSGEPSPDFNAMGGTQGSEGSGTLGGTDGVQGQENSQSAMEELRNVDWESNDIDYEYCEKALVLYVGSWTGNFTKTFSTENFYDYSLNNYSVQGTFNFDVDEHGEIQGTGSGSISGAFGPDRGTSTYKKTTLENSNYTFGISGDIDCATFKFGFSTTSDPEPTLYYEYMDDYLGRTGSYRTKVSSYFVSPGITSTGFSAKISPIELSFAKTKTKEGVERTLNINPLD